MVGKNGHQPLFILALEQIFDRGLRKSFIKLLETAAITLPDSLKSSNFGLEFPSQD
jgi:hypothetical protein